MNKITISYVKPEYFSDGSIKNVICFDAIGDEVYATLISIDKKNLSFVSALNDDRYETILNELNLKNFHHFECAIYANGEIGLIENNPFKDLYFLDIQKDENRITVYRKNNDEYRYTTSNILNSFKNNEVSMSKAKENIREYGDIYFTAKFKNIKELQCFKEFVEEKLPYEVIRRKRKANLTGEDIDMFHEREQETRSESLDAICDTHIDGA